EEKMALFGALVSRDLPDEALPVPDWLLQRISSMYFSGNVRELANMAERIGLVWKLCGQWQRERIERVLDRADGLRLLPAEQRGSRLEPLADVPLSEADQQERARIEDVLRQHGWRRQDTAASLGISRKVLWEKMRKLGIVAPADAVN